MYDVQEFWKFIMRVGRIVSAERVPRTRKLIKLLVDFGNETRTIITGLADQYSPEDFLGKKDDLRHKSKTKKAFWSRKRGDVTSS